jgi:hypothetical protein
VSRANRVCTEHQEVIGDLTKVWGVYVETLIAGTRSSTYQGSVKAKNGEVRPGQNRWQISGGTAKMKGIKGTGACKHTPEAGGYLDYAGSGEHSLAGSATLKPYLCQVPSYYENFSMKRRTPARPKKQTVGAIPCGSPKPNKTCSRTCRTAIS